MKRELGSERGRSTRVVTQRNWIPISRPTRPLLAVHPHEISSPKPRNSAVARVPKVAHADAFAEPRFAPPGDGHKVRDYLPFSILCQSPGNGFNISQGG